MEYPIHKEQNFKYVEVGKGKQTLLLLHGLFGALSNFKALLNHFGKRYKVVVPLLPILELPLREVSVLSLTDYVRKFVEYRGYKNVHLLGNSLGGHIALLYTLQYPTDVRTLTLTGSSGLFESSLGSTFPKRGDYEFIKERTIHTFYNPELASKELIDEVYDIVNDRQKVLQIIATAKSAIRQNLEDKLHTIEQPTLLIWGEEDTVTPPFVGEGFHKLIKNSQLYLVKKCGHAPMMEQPQEFNAYLDAFLNNHTEPEETPS
jgi:pimeloyl-ACP methyl ester carboxylesterase